MLLQIDLGLFGFIFLSFWLIVLLVILILSIFWVMMLIDCAKRDFKDKLVWILIILFAHILGAILYYYIVKKNEDKKKQEIFKR